MSSAIRLRRATSLGGLASLLVLGADCGRDRRSEHADATPQRDTVTLRGAGATFPYPLLARWFADFEAARGAHIGYRSLGSGEGLRALDRGDVDFAVSEFPEGAGASASPPLRFPLVAGAVAITYNVPGLSAPLRLDAVTLAEVYLGRIRRWNDRRIAAANPSATLPALPIVVVHRGDSSGTTRIFTSFLAAHSRAWREGPGVAMSVRWPLGVSERGNEGVAARVKQSAGAIGFVELTYVRQSRLPAALVRAGSGEFVGPSVASIDRALSAVIDSALHSARSSAPIADVGAPGAYPISSLSWLVIADSSRSPAVRRTIGAFVEWALLEGSARARELDYAPLPPSAARRVAERARQSLGGDTTTAAR